MRMRILISAGPTREKIDPVRYISNYSSGKMGYALAEAAKAAGHEVLVVSGPVSEPEPAGVAVKKVESAAEMSAEMKKNLPWADLVIMAAAVADYRPAEAQKQKMKKTSDTLFLELERTEDILSSLSSMARPGQIIAGFAAETNDLLMNALEKLRTKKADWIIANDVGRSDRGFSSDNNAVTMLSHNGDKIEMPLASKRNIAAGIIAALVERGPQVERAS